MRLIDERELIRRISELPDLRTISTGTIGKIIKERTTIDAEPVRHGRWIRHGCADIWRCSECKKYAGFPDPYCPKCGAKMRGENECSDG